MYGIYGRGPRAMGHVSHNMWRHLSTGKTGLRSIGWQCTVNHRRRFISVGEAHLGSVNDKTACRYDDFPRAIS